MRSVLSRIGLSVAKQAATVIAHEGGHYAAAKACGLRPRVSFAGSGAKTVYDPGATPAQNVLITLAGPALQAAFILVLARKKSVAVPCAVALASVARNFAPVPSSDGEKLYGGQPDSAVLRGAAYWTTSMAALALGCVKKDGWTLLEQISIYDLYVGKARRWVERGELQARTRVKGFEL